MEEDRFSFRRRLACFRYAFRGVALLRYERNARVHAVIGVCTLIAGFLLNISPLEWIVIILVIGTVLAAETFNTSIEKLSDVVSPEYSESIRHIKDLSAGAVLLTAISAAIIGLIIFLPKIIAW
jgi:diacylglycerol kinase (ATP)